MLSQKKSAKSAQKLFFATMHEKHHENAKNPENATFCHNNAEKSANQMQKNVTFAENCEFLSRKKVLVSFLHFFFSRRSAIFHTDLAE
jgi:hypothetical protein